MRSWRSLKPWSGLAASGMNDCAIAGRRAYRVGQCETALRPHPGRPMTSDAEAPRFSAAGSTCGVDHDFVALRLPHSLSYSGSTLGDGCISQAAACGD